MAFQFLPLYIKLYQECVLFTVRWCPYHHGTDLSKRTTLYLSAGTNPSDWYWGKERLVLRYSTEHMAQLGIFIFKSIKTHNKRKKTQFYNSKLQ